MNIGAYIPSPQSYAGYNNERISVVERYTIVQSL
jgi:hypothetical protein